MFWDGWAVSFFKPGIDCHGGLNAINDLLRKKKNCHGGETCLLEQWKNGGIMLNARRSQVKNK